MEVLREQGVDTVFGYPGGTALNVYDSLYDYQNQIHHVLTAHEQEPATPPTGMPAQPEKQESSLRPAGRALQIL